MDEKTSTLLRLVYKKIAVFLRSLISFVRIVPAYDVARRFRAQISYDISSPEEEEEESLEKKNPTFDCVVSNVHFTPIVAPFGTLIVSSMYRRNMSLDGKLIAETTMTSPSMISNQDSRQRRRSWTPTQKTNMIDDTDDWIVPRRTSILQDYDKRDSFERYRYSPCVFFERFFSARIFLDQSNTTLKTQVRTTASKIPIEYDDIEGRPTLSSSNCTNRISHVRTPYA